MSETKTPKPFCKFVGGKAKLLPELHARIPKKFGAYFEPFVGGGALFWSLVDRLDEAYISDTNERLMASYRAVRDDVDGLVRRLRALARASERAPAEHYYRTRAKDVDGKSDAEIAAWFLYLNKTGYNGLYRVNRSGKFNVPFGKHANPTICDADLLRACSKALQAPLSIEIASASFEKASLHVRKGDLVFFDPPYLPISKTSDFTAYGSGGFGLADHARLRDVARDLKSRGATVLVSNSDCPEIRKLYSKGFRIDRVYAPRSINSNGAKRGKIAEVIIS